MQPDSRVVQRLWKERCEWEARHPDSAYHLYTRRADWAKGKPFKAIDRVWKRLHQKCWSAVEAREEARERGVGTHGEGKLNLRVYRSLTEISALMFPRHRAYLDLTDEEKEEYERSCEGKGVAL